MSDKPWDGRFSERTDTDVEAFTSSIQIDKRLYPYDIAGSIAHAFYGELPQEIIKEVRRRLPQEFLTIIDAFHVTFGR